MEVEEIPVFLPGFGDIQFALQHRLVKALTRLASLRE